MIEGYEDMSDAERRNLIWAMRDGSAAHINRVRRQQFENCKSMILERDMKPSVVHVKALKVAA